MDKGDTKDDLVALRRLICERFIREPGYRFHEMPDPPRARTAADSPAYRQAVADWHAERARLWADAIASELGPGDVGAFLAWGDPSLYDSTLRILDARRRARRHRLRRRPRYHRDPGVDGSTSHPAQRYWRTRAHHHRTATARERIGRQRGGDARRRLLVPAAARPAPASGGAPTSARPTSCCSPARSVRSERSIVAARADARAEHGWIMDTYLLRSAD